VLAFFAQRLISPGQEEQTPTYSEFKSQVQRDPQSIQEVTFQPKTNTIEVKQQDGKQYSTGYPNNVEPQLTNLLQRNHIETKVQGTGGAMIWAGTSVLTKTLPPAPVTWVTTW